MIILGIFYAKHQKNITNSNTMISTNNNHTNINENSADSENIWENSSIPAPPYNLQELCSLESIDANEMKRVECEIACEGAACCMAQKEEDNCILSNRERCARNANCFNLIDLSFPGAFEKC